MTDTTLLRAGPRGETAGFRHEALFYAGDDGFVDATLPFLRDAANAGDPTLVVVSAPRIERLRAELGDDADAIAFADMSRVGANPARIIPAWQAFVDAHEPGRPLRGIGEPISAQRSTAELVECQRHEALLNVAFAEAEDFWLLCPYDTEALPAPVLEKAHHSHPVVVANGTRRVSRRYVDVDVVAEPFADPLPKPPASARALAFTARDLSAVRALVANEAAAAGFDDEQAGDLVLAVNELATNSVRHGGGAGLLRTWHEDGAVICDVTDRGGIGEPLAGRKRPADWQVGGHGLWLVNQVCDLVQIRSFGSGGVVRVHKRR